MSTHGLTAIETLSDAEIDGVGGGLLPAIALGVAMVALAMTAWNSGYGTGRDIAQNEHHR